MIVRSLRWRLVLAMVIIIAAVVAVAGFVSTIRISRELDTFFIEQKRAETRNALRILQDGGPDALRRAYEQSGNPILAVDDANRVVARYPPEMASFAIRFRPDGSFELRRAEDGRSEAIALRLPPHRVRGLGNVYFLPPLHPRERPTVRTGVNKLVIALAVAVLLAVVVMITIFRRVFAPVEALTTGARSLAAGHLDARVPVRGDDEIAELGRAFNSMAVALERNERARRNMVSDVAHELRTPLTNIRVQIEAAQDGVIATDPHFLTSIQEEAVMLARLVDDLQQLSLAEAGQLRLELAEVRVAEIIDRAAPPGVTRDVPPDLTVRVDARRMVQVVRNLVVNALAHAKSRVHITAARVGDHVEIRVEDDGPGIPDEHVERIFDRFYRVDESRSRATGGAGLGLAIARQLVELHGGRIWYERPAFVIALSV